jgi:VanZ family protein
MALTLRQKATIILLAFYWPGLFALAHIPIPQLVRQADVSDKSAHFLSYLILVFFLWFSVSFDRKVDWRRARGWLMLCFIALYGVFDEISQGYVGRNCDIMDLILDIAGTLTGLVLFSIFTFWPSALLVTGIVIFGVTNIARMNLADIIPVTSAVFHLLAYGVFTMLWIRCMHISRPIDASKSRRLASSLVVPIIFLFTVKLFSLLLGLRVDLLDIFISVGAIIAVVGMVSLKTLDRKTSIVERRTKIKPAKE